jgi:hypothetical protein
MEEGSHISIMNLNGCVRLNLAAWLRAKDKWLPYTLKAYNFALRHEVCFALIFVFIIQYSIDFPGPFKIPLIELDCIVIKFRLPPRGKRNDTTQLEE